MASDKRAELERLEAAFEEAGGRGIDLAERIDELREELGDNDELELEDDQ